MAYKVNFIVDFILFEKILSGLVVSHDAGHFFLILQNKIWKAKSAQIGKHTTSIMSLILL